VSTPHDGVLPRVLTVAEVRKLLRCSGPTIYSLIRSGQLPAITFSTNGKRGVVRVTEEDLREFIQRHRRAER
jgi:excisionase family DNA binding protein